ncbi:NAD(P)/FAD-dependent oxidoreductase [Spirulina sp. CS-785/01]|uniref:FAD-dependent oxidoreductase n=1 Tax=Spirulina sp. CS-785/01 TaxID=3021716 RepID=UPI00232EC3C9|nr:NAD(P)/FAD-dependent oxidoreductase [Spirulina sp. CS-785/01]MDB9311952.1 NAD(P)/FAD-dependent oxidoreductase [Spirulina sp. CS-785/01]
MYDLVIIGSTPEGIYAAMTAAALAARVALVSQGGGSSGKNDPLRRLSHLGTVQQTAEQWPQWGIEGEIRGLQWNTAIASLQEAVSTLNAQTAPAILSALGIDWIEGNGDFCRLPQLGFIVKGRKLRSRAYLLATGTTVTPPPESANLGLTIDQLWEQDQLTKLPSQLLIVGGTPQGLELAQSLQQLGKEVTLVADKGLLPNEDLEAVQLLQAQLEANGVKIYTQSPVLQVKKLDQQCWIQAGDYAISAQEIIWATPPQANVKDLNLTGVGVTVKNGKVLTNQLLQTTNSKIYACGTLLGGYHQPHIAQHEASIALKNALYLPLFSTQYYGIPWGIFTSPQLSQVGLLARQAKQRYGKKALIYRQQFKHNAEAILTEKTTGFCKLIIHRNGTILGATVVGTQAAEVVDILAVAVQNKLHLNQLLKFPQLSPSLSEIVRQTALAWKRDRWNKKTWFNRLRKRWLLWRRSLFN